MRTAANTSIPVGTLFALSQSMLRQMLIALSVMAVCVVIHATGVVSALRWWRGQPVAPRYWDVCWLFIRLSGWIVLLHLGEIVVWGLVYFWRGAIGDLASALYFSAVTYTTTGYGDLLLPTEWRLVGAVEALTGILMCGWSTGFFFVVVSRVIESKTRSTISTS